MDGENHPQTPNGEKAITPAEISHKLSESIHRLDDRKPDLPQLDAKAFHGLSGIVQYMAADTEADPKGLLVTFHTVMGNIFGRHSYYEVEATRHYANVFSVLVGSTSKGRKGTSFSIVKKMVEQFLQSWLNTNIKSGLVSGEGIIYHVRDAGEMMRGKKRVFDPGVQDKRLCIFEAELANTLRVATRAGNTLSTTIREAWDTGRLFTLAKNDPVVATGAHISIVAHITAAELTRTLSNTEALNGFANRFLWCYVKRSRLLPFGGNINWGQIPKGEFQKVIEFARTERRIQMEFEAQEFWKSTYPVLSEGTPGIVGAITSRAEAQVIRLALIYAVLDRSEQIKLPHLEAALAVWQYCEESAHYIFDKETKESDADKILKFIRRNGSVTKTALHIFFNKNKKSEEIELIIQQLLTEGKISQSEQGTEGRPTTIYTINETNLTK